MSAEEARVDAVLRKAALDQLEDDLHSRDLERLLSDDVLGELCEKMLKGVRAAQGPEDAAKTLLSLGPGRVDQGNTPMNAAQERACLLATLDLAKDVLRRLSKE